jgi:hypothetical protein
MKDKEPKEPKIPSDIKIKKKISPNSLANLQKPGEPSNSPGRGGWDGNGGTSLKQSYKNYMKNLPEGAVNAVWQGLLFASQSGNTNAIKMLVELSGQQVNDKLIEELQSMPKITITIVDPNKGSDG